MPWTDSYGTSAVVMAAQPWDAARAIDPYLIWADLSGFAGSQTQAAGDAAPVAPLLVALDLDAHAGAPEIGLDYHPVAQLDGRLYATAEVLPGAVGPLLAQPAVHRLEFGFIRAPDPALPGRAAPSRIDRPVMAVIDFGCAFAHERFRNRVGPAWRSRLAGLWDQGASAPTDAAAGWRRPHGQTYGRELLGADIDALFATHRHLGRIDEDAVYHRARFSTSVARRLAHGTHVLDLAAGEPASADPDALPALLFVQLPDYAVDDTSGGSMVTHVMDALRYILDRVEPGQPLVINLSYGAMAGPHDGTTLLERAMDAVVRGRGATGLVLPAGNNFEADGHAEIELTAGSEQALVWQLRPGDSTDSFLELWYPDSMAGLIEVCVEPQGVPPSGWVPLNCTRRLVDACGTGTLGAVIHRRHVASGLNDAMVLLALAPTWAARVGRRPLAPSGLWRVRVRRMRAGSQIELVQEAPPTRVHAWVERDDAPVGSAGAVRQSRLLSGHGPLAPNASSPPGSPVQRRSTGNSIAAGSLTHVIGACLGQPGFSGLLSRYTSSGPSRNPLRLHWPDGVVAADASENLPGVLAAGTRSGQRVRMNGSSVAAPQYARALLAQLSGLRPLPPPLGPVSDPDRMGTGRWPLP